MVISNQVIIQLIPYLIESVAESFMSGFIPEEQKQQQEKRKRRSKFACNTKEHIQARSQRLYSRQLDGKTTRQLVLEHGKIEGIAFNVPVPNGSCVDLTTELERMPTIEEANQAIKSFSEGDLDGIVGYTSDPIVSSDVSVVGRKQWYLTRKQP